MRKDDIKKAMPLYLVTDRRWLNGRPLTEDVEKALQGGVTCVQIREKNLDYDAFVKEALALKKICQKYQVPLIINDRIDVMLEVDADGVHVGQNDMKASEVRNIIGHDKILGVSARTVQEAKDAQNAGADYLGVGAVFGTSTKEDANHLHHKMLKDICLSVDIPVIAIGGINHDNILELENTGISGVAIVSGIMAQKDIKEISSELKDKVEGLIHD